MPRQWPCLHQKVVDAAETNLPSFEEAIQMFTAPTKWSVKTMRAAQFDGIRGRVQVKEMQIPEIDEEDALVRVVTCGICRSDWHLWNGDWGVVRCQTASTRCTRA